MDRSIEDPHITRMIAQQIEGEEEGFEHYATVKAEGNISTPDEWGDTWRTFFIGAREGRLYVAERSSQAEGYTFTCSKIPRKCSRRSPQEPLTGQM